MENEWKIFGFKDFYRVNADGIVQTRLLNGNKFSVNNTGEWKTLTQSKSRTDRHGGFYVNVSLKISDNPTRFKPVRVHRIVAEVFLGKIDKGMEVDHIDGDRTNNRLSNLRIVSHSENIKSAKERGVFDKGQNAFRGKLKKDDISIILQMISEGYNNTEISKIFNIDKSNISRIRTGSWPGLKHL